MFQSNLPAERSFAAVARRGRFWQCPPRFAPNAREHCARRAFPSGPGSTLAPINRGLSMTTLWLIVLCGVLAIVYAIWATYSVMQADPGSEKMQEIAAAVREGAQAYLRRQYTTIAIVGVVIFLIVGYFLGWLVGVGFAIGAILSGAAGFIGMNVSVRANVRTAQAAIELARRRARDRVPRRRHHRPAGRRPRAARRDALFRLPHRHAASGAERPHGRRCDGGARLRRLADLDLRPARRRHLHQGRRRRRRSGRQGRSRHSGGRSAQSRRPSPTTSATMSATAPAWPPTCSRPMR